MEKRLMQKLKLESLWLRGAAECLQKVKNEVLSAVMEEYLFKSYIIKFI